MYSKLPFHTWIAQWSYKATSIFIIVIPHHLLTEENVNFHGGLGIWWFMPLVLVLRRQKHVDVCQFCASQGCAVGFSQKAKQKKHQSILWWEQFKYPSLCVLRNMTHCCSFHSFYCYPRFTVYGTRFKILKAVETHGANTKGPRGDWPSSQ